MSRSLVANPAAFKNGQRARRAADSRNCGTSRSRQTPRMPLAAPRLRRSVPFRLPLVNCASMISQWRLSNMPRIERAVPSCLTGGRASNEGHVMCRNEPQAKNT
jgi:hypothetical protein